MEVKLKIIAIGGTQDIADELCQAIKGILPQDIDIVPLTQSSVVNHTIADLFITMKTRVDELAKAVPNHKIIGVEVLPCRRFFVETARIPANSVVHIFHNNRRGGETFARNLVKYGIDDLSCIYIPFQELEEHQTKELLGQARYIIGTSTLVGNTGILRQKYGKYLPNHLQIIAANRILDLESAAAVMKWVTAFEQRCLAQQVVTIVQNLSHKLQQILAATKIASHSVDSVAAALDKLQTDIHKEVQRVEEVVTISHSLSAAAQDISTIADTIKRISDQTNLLSLNATIEAARVGEHGRGFAVVAKEVGKLASESKQSIDKIRKTVLEVQTAVKQVVPAQEAIAASMTAYKGDFIRVVEASSQERIALSEVFSALDTIGAISEDLLAAVENLG